MRKQQRPAERASLNAIHRMRPRNAGSNRAIVTTPLLRTQPAGDKTPLLKIGLEKS